MADLPATTGLAAILDWWLLADIPDNCPYAVLGDDVVYLLSRQDAPHGKILRLRLTVGGTVADADEVVPTSHLVIEDLVVTRGTLWVADMDGGPQQLRAFDLDGRPRPPPGDPAGQLGVVVLDPPLPARSRSACLVVRVVHGATHVVGGRRRGGASIDGLDDDQSGRPVRLRGDPRVRHLVGRHPGPAQRHRRTRHPARRLRAGAVDGVRRVRDLAGAEVQPEPLLWLERGGVVVVANIRGGGEYGQEWHHAGRLATKQNCFDDFIACADHLVESGITSRDLLAIIGGSNGGLLMGAVITQRPDLARAVVAAVPVMDSLRSETTMNGRYNTTEFGTVEDPTVFKALLDYSPYHNVKDGTDYPAVLLTAGENDTRVDAWHAKKMTARLQAATTSGRPVLLRLEAGGHLAGSLDQNIDETTDVHAFLFDQLALGYLDVATA